MLKFLVWLSIVVIVYSKTIELPFENTINGILANISIGTPGKKYILNFVTTVQFLVTKTPNYFQPKN